MNLRGLVILLLLGLVAGCATVQPGLDSPEAVTKLLEQRWPPSFINEHCRPDTRILETYGGCGALVSPHFAVICTGSPYTNWEGTIRTGPFSGLDEVTWSGGAISGKLAYASIRANRGNDFWYLELCRPKHFTNVLARETLIARRIQRSLWCAMAFRFNSSSKPTNGMEDAGEGYEGFYKLWDLVKQSPTNEHVTLDKRGLKPRHYLAEGEEGRLEVEMNDAGNPDRIFANGVRSLKIEQHYRDWVEWYDLWRHWGDDAYGIKRIIRDCKDYAESNGGNFPEDWTLLNSVKDHSTYESSFVASASRKKPGKMRDVMKWTDFIYLPGHKLTDPEDTVIILSPPKNYEGRKALAATLNGAVRVISPEEYEALIKKAGR